MLYYFKPKLVSTITFIVIFPILLSLGFWQWGRAQTKAAWINTLKAQTILPLDLALGDPKAAQYHRIELKGHFLPEPTLLLMHQAHQGVQGYQVINFFLIDGQSDPILVNRGFIAKSKVAELPPPPGQIGVLRGIIDRPKSDRFILGSNILDPALRPLPVQRLDLAEFDMLFHTQLLPLVILADQDLGGGLICDWQITPRMPPEKHLGYAVQWFALALCLAIIYLCVNLKKRL